MQRLSLPNADMKREKPNFDELEARADALLDSGKVSAAEKILKRMLAMDENCLGAHFNLARVYKRKGDFEKALLHGKRTIEISPREANAYLNLGVIYEELGDIRRATACYKKELSRDPLSVETLWNFGQLLFEKHRWKQASRCLQRCFDLGYWHEAEQSLWKLGRCYFKLNDLRTFIRAYERYANTRPDSAWAAEGLGRALLHAKEFRQACVWLMKAKRLGADSKDVDQDIEAATKGFRKTQRKKTTTN
jgi:tetratricopeptide (TPR) repeat protein